MMWAGGLCRSVLKIFTLLRRQTRIITVMEIVNDLVVHGVSLLQAVEAAIYCVCCLTTVVGYVAEFALTGERMYEVHPAGSIMIV